MRKLEGLLIQTAADTSTTLLRETGANDDDFEAVELVYIRSVVSQATMKLWAPPCEFVAGVSGKLSMVGQRIVLVASAISSPTDCVFEWYPPPGTELMFDEFFEIQVDSVGTGQANAIYYEIYYNIVKSTEMELVKAKAGY